jgi:hypothetical protein
MADILKILGQSNPLAVTLTELYATPALSATTTSTLVVCNRAASAAVFRVSVRQSGDSADNEQYLFYDAPLAGNSTLTAVIGMTLAESDQVFVYTDLANLSFNLFGVETS